MGNNVGTGFRVGAVAALTTLAAVGTALVIFNPVGAVAVTAYALGATLGPPACIVAGLLFDHFNDKKKTAKGPGEDAASQAARRQAEEKARQEARRQAEERARQEARRQAEERARQEARRQAEERARQEARRLVEERARQEARRQAEERDRQEARRQAEEKARQEARRQAEERARQEARRQAEEKARQEARRQAEEKARQEARRQAEEKARQEARRLAEEKARQEARRQAEEKARQEARRRAEEKASKDAIDRCNELTNDGLLFYREGWRAEEDGNSKLAGVKFQNSYDKLDEACRVDPSNAKSVQWREVCRLKIEGNARFNEGIELQGKGRNHYQEALGKFREAKEAFAAAFARNKDTGFQECMAIVDESVEATNVARREENGVQDRRREREIRTERADAVQLIGVVDHVTRR